ncbi:hypothetical protein FOCG_10703 [Fusarium oxysporum f. sp. radicis-lycopersici 26381]|uniref:Uncharacterized protein n=1 Tax=Fusarium oxysporum Fo47 TaxID=660027 RepID=W9JXY2_FUSOX|nr:hypothetical protein FOZG_12473 [Fusarium oxysporum Fo47]EXL48231.1 hypothetical protein FOCG_10703 [Fusarium oxysporum f. sp. radicis-lycopersici 26381]
MPDFRPLFFIAKVLTCCCCCSRRKPENARAADRPYGTSHGQRTGSSSENVSDYSEYSVPPAYPGGPMNLIHPDEFEHPDESLVPCPPTPRPSSSVDSEVGTTRPSTAKPDTMRPSTTKSTNTKTISDEPVASPSVIVEITATDSVTEMLLADEPSVTKLAGPVPIRDEPTATKSVSTEPEPEAEPVEAGPTDTKTDRPNFVNVDLAEAGPLKSDIEASSDAVGPTENKDEDKGKEKVSV